MSASRLETEPTLAVLSPHYDDAVLSCGALLARRQTRGLRTLVLTAMSTGGQRVWFKQRREEDSRALGLLGCEGKALGMTDAPMRGHGYYDGLIFGEEPAGSPLVGELINELTKAVTKSKAGALLAPLGAGNHVDHRACFAAARYVSAQQKLPLYLYEDRPYALVEGATEARLYSLGLESRTPWARAKVHALLTALEGAPYFQRFVPAGPLRTKARTRWTALLGEPAPVPDGALRAVEALLATHDEAKRAGDSLEEYRSQYADLYGDRATHDALTLAHARRYSKEATRVERYFGLG